MNIEIQDQRFPLVRTVKARISVPVVDQRPWNGREAFVMGVGARYLQKHGWRLVGEIESGTHMLPPPYTLPGTIRTGSVTIATVELPLHGRAGVRLDTPESMAEFVSSTLYMAVDAAEELASAAQYEPLSDAVETLSDDLYNLQSALADVMEHTRS